MPENRKLLLLRLDNETYEKLRPAALESHRVIGTELVLRLANAMNDYKTNPENIISTYKVKIAVDNKVVQVLISIALHTLLKTTAAASNMLLKDFATRLLVNSLDSYTFVASVEQAIAKNTK